ncbi:MAG: hypothetical protein ABSE89_04195 [Sedimentisphaerales bacterium]
MGRTKGNIIELFIDKVVLAIAAIIALIILLIFVIGSPNSVEHNGEKISPGKIDEAVQKDAEELQRKLQEKVQDSNSYIPQTSFYLGLVKNSVKITDTKIHFPLPGSSTEPGVESGRTYQVPKIGQTEKPSIAAVTMAAYVPIEELTDEVTYDKAETKLEDIDLVTVESSINAKQLYEDFHNAFAGKNIPNEHREEQYGKPVFAQVELQRKTLLKDGSWSQWIEISRTKISQKKTLQLPAQADDYSTQIALEQFAKTEIRDEVLQPPVYDNAIPAEKWICPPFYNERQKKLEKEKEDLKKQLLEAEKSRKLQERAAPKRAQPGRTVPTPLMQKSKPATDSTESRAQPQTLTEEQQYNEIKLSEKTNPAGLEKLVFWAHDDTVIPGEKYQYRIRIGVLNPIAGKPWFNEDQKDLQNQIVLFSNYSESDPNKPIEIPQHLYFFATDSREKEKSKIADKTVDIKVARYTMGNWITKTFNVKAGDQIGAVIEAAGTKLEKAGIQAESIDLSTGNIMVDTIGTTGWAGTGKITDFEELLYCKPGQTIERMPIKERFWPEETTKVYKEISDAEAAEAVVLLTRTEAKSGISAKPGSAPSGASPGPETGTTPPAVKTPPAVRTPPARTPPAKTPTRTTPSTRRQK